jgi:hypothetical protein
VQPPSRATFTLWSSTHTSEAVTQRFGIEPTRVHERGEPVCWRNPNSKLREETTWYLQSGIPETQPLADHLADLLDQMEPRRPILTSLLDEGCEFDWFCHLEAQSLGNMVRVDALLVGRLAALGGAITFDIYNGDPD